MQGKGGPWAPSIGICATNLFELPWYLKVPQSRISSFMSFPKNLANSSSRFSLVHLLLRLLLRTFFYIYRSQTCLLCHTWNFLDFEDEKIEKNVGLLNSWPPKPGIWNMKRLLLGSVISWSCSSRITGSNPLFNVF